MSMAEMETNDSVGGLVGYNDSGTITASYATGTADGGADAGDDVGVPGGIKRRRHNHRTGYAFGTATGENVDHNGTPHLLGVTEASGLTTSNTPTASWNNAGNNTLDAWNFGMELAKSPALVYADYDGTTGSANKISL